MLAPRGTCKPRLACGEQGWLGESALTTHFVSLVVVAAAAVVVLHNPGLKLHIGALVSAFSRLEPVLR